MREIKFRGKRIDNGEWIVGNLIVNKSKILIQPLDNYVAGIVGHIKVDPKTVGQFTGLKANNGAEVWDVDIVSGNEEEFLEGHLIADYTCMGIVSWDENMGQWIITDHHSGEIYPLYDYEPIDKVIGNIHDNPELIS